MMGEKPSARPSEDARNRTQADGVSAQPDYTLTRVYKRMWRAYNEVRGMRLTEHEVWAILDGDPALKMAVRNAGEDVDDARSDDTGL